MNHILNAPSWKNSKIQTEMSKILQPFPVSTIRKTEKEEENKHTIGLQVSSNSILNISVSRE